MNSMQLRISYDKTKMGLMDILFIHPRKRREGGHPAGVNRRSTEVASDPPPSEFLRNRIDMAFT